jgi:hypothetical protein
MFEWVDEEMTYIAPSFKYFQIFPEFIGGPLESDGLPSGLHWGTIGCPVPPDWGSVWTIGGPFARCWTPSSNTGCELPVVEVGLDSVPPRVSRR